MALQFPNSTHREEVGERLERMGGTLSMLTTGTRSSAAMRSTTEWANTRAPTSEWSTPWCGSRLRRSHGCRIRLPDLDVDGMTAKLHNGHLHRVPGAGRRLLKMRAMPLPARLRRAEEAARSRIWLTSAPTGRRSQVGDASGGLGDGGTDDLDAFGICSSVTTNGGARRKAVGVTPLTTSPRSRQAAISPPCDRQAPPE